MDDEHPPVDPFVRGAVTRLLHNNGGQPGVTLHLLIRKGKRVHTHPLGMPDSKHLDGLPLKDVISICAGSLSTPEGHAVLTSLLAREQMEGLVCLTTGEGHRTHPALAQPTVIKFAFAVLVNGEHCFLALPIRPPGDMEFCTLSEAEDEMHPDSAGLFIAALWELCYTLSNLAGAQLPENAVDLALAVYASQNMPTTTTMARIQTAINDSKAGKDPGEIIRTLFALSSH